MKTSLVTKHFRALRRDKKLSREHPLCAYYKLECCDRFGRICPIYKLYKCSCDENTKLQEWLKIAYTDKGDRVLRGVQLAIDNLTDEVRPAQKPVKKEIEKYGDKVRQRLINRGIL